MVQKLYDAFYMHVQLKGPFDIVKFMSRHAGRYNDVYHYVRSSVGTAVLCAKCILPDPDV